MTSSSEAMAWFPEKCIDHLALIEKIESSIFSCFGCRLLECFQKLLTFSEYDAQISLICPMNIGLLINWKQSPLLQMWLASRILLKDQISFSFLSLDACSQLQMSLDFVSLQQRSKL